MGATDLWLCIRVNPPSDLKCNGETGEKWGVAWVENLGYAMLERITLTIGNGGEVEVLSGDILNIQNEMFKDSGNRLHNHILKTSVTPFPTTLKEDLTQGGGGVNNNNSVDTSRTTSPASGTMAEWASTSRSGTAA